MSQLAEAASEEGAESELLATHRCLALGLVPCSRGHGRERFRGAPHPAGDLGEVSERLLVESSKRKLCQGTRLEDAEDNFFEERNASLGVVHVHVDSRNLSSADLEQLGIEPWP